jgi:hypothetical protein
MMKNISVRLMMLATSISLFCADSHEFVPVKSSRSMFSRVCDGMSCQSSNSVRQDAYKVDTHLARGQKVHIEHKEVSDIIDIDGLDVDVPILQNIKLDDASTALQSTDRSLQSEALQQVDGISKVKPVQARSTWQQIKDAFSSPQDINAPNKRGVRPLEQAITDGNVQQIVQLVKAGAHLNFFNRSGDGLLHQVIKSASLNQKDYTYPAILEFLLDHGVKIDVQNKLGQTPLHCAAVTLNREMIDILITHKANLNLQDNQGQTPLMAVIHRAMPPMEFVQRDLQQKQAEVIRDLIFAGADITIPDQHNRLPIDDANYQIKVHGMLPEVGNYLSDRYAVLNKKLKFINV